MFGVESVQLDLVGFVLRLLLETARARRQLVLLTTRVAAHCRRTVARRRDSVNLLVQSPKLLSDLKERVVN